MTEKARSCRMTGRLRIPMSRRELLKAGVAMVVLTGSALAVGGCAEVGAMGDLPATGRAAPGKLFPCPSGGPYIPTVDNRPPLKFSQRKADAPIAAFMDDPSLPAYPEQPPFSMFFGTSPQGQSRWAEIEARLSDVTQNRLSYCACDALPEADREAIDADAETAVDALARYLFAKYGFTLSERCKILWVGPVICSPSGSDTANTADGFYTGYFRAELANASDDEGSQGDVRGMNVVFSPLGSTEHLPLGGMDDWQYDSFADAALKEMAPCFPQCSADAYEHGGSYAIQPGTGDVFFSYDPLPELGGAGRGLLSVAYPEGDDWKSALVTGSEVKVSVMYVDSCEELGSWSFEAAASLFSEEAFVDVACSVEVSCGLQFSDWNLYRGGTGHQWGNAFWWETHDEAPVDTDSGTGGL